MYKLSYFDIIIIIMKKFSDSSNRFRCEKKKKIQYIDINNVLVTLVCAVIINNTLNLIYWQLYKPKNSLNYQTCLWKDFNQIYVLNILNLFNSHVPVDVFGHYASISLILCYMPTSTGAKRNDQIDELLETNSSPSPPCCSVICAPIPSHWVSTMNLQYWGAVSIVEECQSL